MLFTNTKEEKVWPDMHTQRKIEISLKNRKIRLVTPIFLESQDCLIWNCHCNIEELLCWNNIAKTHVIQLGIFIVLLVNILLIHAIPVHVPCLYGGIDNTSWYNVTGKLLLFSCCGSVTYFLPCLNCGF